MRTPKPPAWLRRTLGSEDSTEGLLGDLIEECERGRSRGWFWCQVIAATIIFSIRDLRSHKALAFRGTVIGWMVFIAVTFMVGKGLSISAILLTSTATGWDGWIVGLALWFLIFAAIITPRVAAGWIVGRLHRPHGVAMGVGLACSFLIGELALMVAIMPSAANVSFWITVQLTGAVAGTLVGGVWGSGSSIQVRNL